MLAAHVPDLTPAALRVALAALKPCKSGDVQSNSQKQTLLEYIKHTYSLIYKRQVEELQHERQRVAKLEHDLGTCRDQLRQAKVCRWCFEPYARVEPLQSIRMAPPATGEAAAKRPCLVDITNTAQEAAEVCSDDDGVVVLSGDEEAQESALQPGGDVKTVGLVNNWISQRGMLSKEACRH